MERIKVRYSDEKGRAREEVFETRSIKEMRKAFQDQGYYIISEEKEQLGLAERFQKILNIGSKASIKELNEFTKLLRTLIKSGMPINDALEVLLDGAVETPLNLALRQVKEDIGEGVSLSSALARHPDVFPDIYVKTIVAGEKAGALENILKRLTEYFVSSMAIRRKIIAALIYPSILLLVSSLAVSYMVVAVVPEFAGLFKSLDVPLPLMTSVLLSTSEFLGEWFYLIVFALILAGFGIYSYSKSPEGKRAIDNLKLSIPVVRDLETNYAYSQFSRTLGTMVEGGIPLLDSLEVVLGSIENKVLAARFAILPELLEKGLGFGKSLKKIQGAPRVMVKVIHVGEESGNLSEMLDNLADHYDEEITETTDAITALIEPVLFLGMALVVGTLVVALLYPVLTAASNIN
ncbi:MAG: type pilus assembly protein PilC [Clostridiales bacterium]|nr:type pilus assembly protein PilC [Clostridiales bacterium]MDN5283333.1 type pilus assembly protein PilC [Candidatus Ozemobacter sp.]